MRRVLLDTGPLVAFLNRRDRYHDWARAQWENTATPLFTCEAVLAESCHLLRQLPGGSPAVIELLTRGVIAVPFRLQDDAPAVGKLLSRYADIPMSLADACLVRMSEHHGESTVLTLDKDFRIYRRHGRQVIPALTPHAR